MELLELKEQQELLVPRERGEHLEDLDSLESLYVYPSYIEMGVASGTVGLQGFSTQKISKLV